MIKKLGHIILVLLLLVFTTSFTIQRHFCHQELVDAALFSHAESCCTPDGQMNHESHSERADQLPDHCGSDIIHTRTVDNFVITSSEFQFDVQVFKPLVLDQSTLFGDLQNSSETWGYPLSDASPPTVNERLSLIQVYLL